MRRIKRWLGNKAALVVGAWAVYVLAFIPLYDLIGPAVLMLTTPPLIVLGWYYGMWVGLLGGLLSIPLNILLLVLADRAGWRAMDVGMLTGSILLMLTSAVIGRLHDIGERLKHELDKRQRTEEALRQSKERFRRIAVTIEDILYVVDGKTQEFSYLSPAFERVLGYTLADVQRMGGRQAFLLQVVQKSQFTEQRPNFEQLLAGDKGQIPPWEAWWRCKDGSLICLEDRCVPLYDGERLVSVQGVLRDITERVQTEQAMHRRHIDIVARNAVSRALAGSWELQDILDEALSQITRVLGFSGGLIALMDRHGDQLELFSYHHLPSSLVERWQTQGSDDALCDFLLLHEGQLNLEDLREGTSVDARDLLAAGLRFCVGTPIVHQEHHLGVFCLFATKFHPIAEIDYNLLATIGQQIGVAVENVRLFERVAREREVAQTLLDTAEALSSTLRIDELLEHILDELLRVVPYDAASIALLRGEQCWIVASRGLESVPSAGFTLAECPLVQRVIRGRRPIAVPDVRDEPDWISLGNASSTRSRLGVPLVSRGGVIGILMVDSSDPNVYDESEKRLTFAFANHAALAIENSRLYERARAQLRETSLIHNVTAALSSILDEDQILSYMARSLCQILNGTSAEIYLLDQRANTVNLVANYAASKATEEENCWDVDQRVGPLKDVSAVANVLNSGDPVQLYLEDPGMDPRDASRLRARGAQATLLLPMVAREQTLGFAQVWESQGPRRFTEGEIALGQTLIWQASVALNNARLLIETQKSARQMQSLYETSSALASLDEENVMYAILEAVYRTLGCEYVLIANVDQEADTIDVRHSIWRWEFDTPPEWIQVQPSSLDHPGIFAAVCRTGQVEIVETWDERFDRQIWEAHDLDRLLRIFMPIKVRDTTMGILEVGYDKQALAQRKGQVDDDAVQILAAFADQAAVALQNARLFTETRRRVRELRLLHDVALAAASGVRLEDTLQAAVEALANQFGNVYVAVALVDHKTDTLYQAAGVGPTSEKLSDLRVPMGEGIVGWVAQRGEPALVPDVRLDPRYIEVVPDTRSELCAPLAAGALVIGVLNIESPQVNAFTEDDLQLLSTLASNLAVLVERARLFEEVETAGVELQQRAEALEEANERLKELDRLKSQFLANMSHELRTPLNSIIGFSDVLLGGLVGRMTDEQKECVEDIHSSGVHLLTLINDVLDLSKIEAKQMRLKFETFDVTEPLMEVQSTIAPMVKKKSQVLSFEMTDELPLLTADRLRLKQILLNLLSNAHKFTPEGGSITLSCRLADDATMLFSVTDTGLGIKPEDQEIIFEEFRQVGEPSVHGISGTGLGLAISKRLVEMHEGHLWVESEHGHGATFSFILPIAGPGMC